MVQEIADSSGVYQYGIDMDALVRSLEQQIAQQEAQLNAYADKIYQQAQHIELLEDGLRDINENL